MYKATKIAEAPDELAKCINKYSTHKAFVSRGNINTLDRVNVVHYHNKWKRTVSKPSVIQYHSEPNKVNHNFNGKKLVVAQYHATLPQYKDCKPMRNIIDFEDDGLYKYKEISKIKIGFSPSIKVRLSEWYDKGYEETKEILERLANKYSIEYDIITEVSLSDAIKRKSECSIVIDECVTSSYHRSSLEGLALGKLTICSIGDSVQGIVYKTSGSYLPIENISIDDLYNYIAYLIECIGIKEINKKGKENRDWMFNYWHPKNIVSEYIKVYEEVINEEKHRRRISYGC